MSSAWPIVSTSKLLQHATWCKQSNGEVASFTSREVQLQQQVDDEKQVHSQTQARSSGVCFLFLFPYIFHPLAVNHCRSNWNKASSRSRSLWNQPLGKARSKSFEKDFLMTHDPRLLNFKTSKTQIYDDVWNIQYAKYAIYTVYPNTIRAYQIARWYLKPLLGSTYFFVQVQKCSGDVIPVAPFTKHRNLRVCRKTAQGSG